MPRAGLSADVVVAEALRLADERGADGVTLAAIAQRFGVAVPSLYKHVEGIEDVRQRLAALAVCELGQALATAAEGKASAAALRAMAGAYRAYALEHPGRYAAGLRAPDPGDRDHTAAVEAVLATVLAVMAGYGLDGDEAIDATRAVRSALHGFVNLEAAGGFGLPQDVGRSFGRLVDALDRALAGWPGARGLVVG